MVTLIPESDKMGGVSWWSAKSLSFKVNRKSEAASVLKSSISSKLLDFLSDYSDDVLAEYITVLVCNGKSQYQARDDLDAFLGERTADFVSWLWDSLLSHASQSNGEIVALSDQPDVANVGLPQWQTKNDGGSDAGHETVPFTNKSNMKVVDHESGRLSDELLPPKSEETPSSHLKPSSSENAYTRHISASNENGASLSAHPTSVVSHSHNSGRPRVSVWDRLGKPCDDTPGGTKPVHVRSIGLMKQDEQRIKLRQPMLPGQNGEQGRMVTGEVPGLDNNNLAESIKLDNVVGTICETHAVNNIRRKRHFGDISAGLDAGPAPLVGDRNPDLLCKQNSQDFKKSNLTKDSKTATPKMASEVLDVKQRLHQIEMEMEKLRSRQVKMEKDGKPNLLSNSRSLKLPEDSESRTIFVTNLHFAATEKALSLYFSKCGAVVNVAIVTDKSTLQQRGSAYVTFASEESVDKALELNGAQFFSRTIKVTRKAESAGGTSGAAQVTGSQFQAPSTHITRNFTPNKLNRSSSHLQWRRVSTPDSSKPSVPTSAKVTLAASSATHSTT